MAGNAPASGKGKVDLRLSAMSLIWNDPVGDAFLPWLKEVKAAGYEGITCFGNKIPHLDNPAAFRRMLDDNGLQLAAVDLQMHRDDDRYHRMFEFMQALNCQLFVAIDPSGGGKDYAMYGAWLNHIGELSLPYGIRTHYHNHTNAIGETFGDMERLIGELDENLVSLMLDVGHATKDFREFPPEARAYAFLKKHWNRLHYLEFKDWNERTDLNTPLGEGYADYDGIFDLMRTEGYAGWITVEQNGNDGWSLGRSPLECARISREFLSRHLQV